MATLEIRDLHVSVDAPLASRARATRGRSCAAST